MLGAQPSAVAKSAYGNSLASQHTRPGHSIQAVVNLSHKQGGLGHIVSQYHFDLGIEPWLSIQQNTTPVEDIHFDPSRLISAQFCGSIQSGRIEPVSPRYVDVPWAVEVIRRRPRSRPHFSAVLVQFETHPNLDILSWGAQNVNVMKWRCWFGKNSKFFESSASSSISA